MNDVVTCEPVRTPVGASRGALSRLSASEQDERALRSQKLCATAMGEGRFEDEIVPVPLPGRRSAPAQVVTQDEHSRPDTTLVRLAALRPVRQDHDPDSTVTAGNSSGPNDGAARCVVTTRDEAHRLGRDLCIGDGQGVAAVFEALW